jgi:hypothetical protein
MKRFLFIITMLASFTAGAQQTDSLKFTASEVTVDSLMVRLSSLERNYDYLYCDHELAKLTLELKDLANSISITSNSLLIRCFNARYDREQYYAYSGLYDAYVNNIEASKRKVEAVKIAVAAKVLTSNFTEQELNVIASGFDLVDSTVATIESALKQYNAVINIYSSMR